MTLPEFEPNAGGKGPSDPVHEHEGKFYFWDETWSNRMGPYDSRRQADTMLAQYCDWLHGEDHGDPVKSRSNVPEEILKEYAAKDADFITGRTHMYQEGQRVEVLIHQGMFPRKFEAKVTGHAPPYGTIVQPFDWEPWMTNFRNASLDPDGCLTVPTMDLKPLGDPPVTEEPQASGDDGEH